MSKKYLLVLFVLAFIVGFIGLSVFSTEKAQATGLPHVTICHKQSQPWLTLSVSIAAVPAHLAHGDSLGVCPEVTPTPTVEPTAIPTVEPTVEPTKMPEPTINPCEVQEVYIGDWEEVNPCVTPTPTEPEATPSATPIPTEEPKHEDNHETASNNATAPAAPICNIPFEAPTVWYTKVNGKVTFNWATSAEVDKFAIVYGRTADNLEWGVDNIPSNLRSLDINGLEGTTWFQVWGFKNGCAEKSKIIDP